MQLFKFCFLITDICIACCKNEYELMEKSHIDLVVHHPLFFGSICESCVHDVATACKLPYGKKQASLFASCFRYIYSTWLTEIHLGQIGNTCYFMEKISVVGSKAN